MYSTRQIIEAVPFNKRLFTRCVTKLLLSRRRDKAFEVFSLNRMAVKKVGVSDIGKYF